MSFYSFTSADSGAPTLTGQNGSLVTLLDWVLVTKGGWTKSFSGTNKAIYRAPSGNRFPLRVVHDSAVSGSATRATVRGCESATGIDTVTDPFPTVAQASDNNANWVVSNTSDATARSYWGVVSDTWLWLFVAYNTNICQGMFYGDCAPTFSGDTYATLIYSQNSTVATPSFWNLPGAVAASPRWFWARSFDGTVKSTTANAKPIDNNNSLLGTFSTSPSYPAYPHPVDSKLHMQKVCLNCWGSTNNTSSTTKQTPGRAWLPNLWAPMHSQTAITSGDTYSSTGYNAAATFRLFSGAISGAAAFCALEITDTWAAP